MERPASTSGDPAPRPPRTGGVASRPTAGSGPSGRPPSVGFLLSQLGYATAARFSEALGPLGLEPRQFATLRALAANEGQSQQAVCAAVNVPPSRMVALVDELEERGLVERRTNPADRRARAIHLTGAGRELLGEAVERAVEFERWVSAPLTVEERDALLDLLSRLVGHYGMSGRTHPAITTPGATPWPGGAPLPVTPRRPTS